ncbi:beta-galactosidase [bacterium]|nr:beta-galactosidase [bacterium]
MNALTRISRRDFLTALGVLPAGGAILLASACRGRGGGIEVGRDGFVIDSRVYPLYSGTVHYWCHEPARWPELLDNLSRLGLITLRVDIPWSLHERAQGGFDFGSGRAELDLDSFLKQAATRGMRVLARPGPFQGHEVQDNGIPRRVLFDPRVPARGSDGNMEIHFGRNGQYPLPSCFSQAFEDEVGSWFDLVGQLLKRHLCSAGGPVIGVQVDDGAGLFIHSRYVYSLDYSLPALDSYRSWLAGLYTDIEELNNAYGSDYPSFESVEPPRRFEAENPHELPRHLDWVEFREVSIARHLDRLASMLVKRGVEGVPVFAALPSGFRAPFNPEAVESSHDIAFAGFDNSGSGTLDYLTERRSAKMASGISRYPFHSGFTLGAALENANVPLTPEEFEFLALTAVMQGLRGLNFHLAAEADNWTGGAFTRDCRVRGEYCEPLRRVVRFLRESRFQDYSKQAETIVLFNRGLDRLSAALEHRRDMAGLDLGGEVFNETADLGLLNSPETCTLWLDQATELMREVGFDWDCGDSAISAERLCCYKVAILSCSDYLDRREIETLRAFVSKGGALVFGPGRPYLDQSMHRNLQVENFFAGAMPLADYLAPAGRTQAANLSLIQMESPHEVGRLIKTLGISPRFTRANTSLDLSFFQNLEGAGLLFVANSSDRPQHSDIFFQGLLTVTPYGRAEASVMEGSLRVELAPRSLAIWEVRP